MDFGISGKTAFVAASTGGLGLAIARALAAEGVRVAITGRREVRAKEIVAELTDAFGPGAVAIEADLSTAEGVAAAVERVQTLVSQNLGPAPLAFDERYGKRMADLALYIRQHHAMRDDAQLGTLTLTGSNPW